VPGYSEYTAGLGDLGALFLSSRKDINGRLSGGAGRTYRDPARGRVLAVGEALERFAQFTVDESQLTTASAVELGDVAMDLDRVPRCSVRERRRPGCPVTAPDKTRPIRWVSAVDLHSGSDVLVPATMACLGLERWPAERFWIPISTGGAVHVTFEAAIVNGICEVIERDALTLTWLQKLPLPRLADDRLPADAREIVHWCAEHGIDTRLFDATTNVGVPTVYCLQTTRDPTIDRMAQVVACATNFDPSTAAVRAVLEAIGIRAGLIADTDYPRRYRDFASVTDGALMMGRRRRRGAFGFLLDDLPARPVSWPGGRRLGSDLDRLAFLLRRLNELGMSAYVVDLTRRELDLTDLVAVQVIVPELQPMSLRPSAQYRGHPRLYDAPARMGMRVLPESRLNPFPQPMA
jgi:ribosomal protein S12 methylthiotransferase accessory factor